MLTKNRVVQQRTENKPVNLTKPSLAMSHATAISRSIAHYYTLQ